MQMRRGLKQSLLIGCLAVATSSFGAKSTVSTYHKAYIGVFVTQHIGSSFYPVLMSKDETPYINISDTLEKWLQAPFTLNDGVFKVTIPNTQGHYWLNVKTKQYGVEGAMTFKLPKDALLHIKGKYWLRYDIWSKWLPVNSKWAKENYELYLIPQFKLSSEMEAERKKTLIEEQLQATNQKEIKSAKPIKPKTPFDAQARYNVNWSRPMTSDQNLGVNYAANVDVFDGTLQSTGTSNVTNGKNSSSPIFWNYTLKDKPNYHILQFGDFFKEQTPLIPALSFKNGINFARLEQKNSANGFNYHGNTQPGTEVDVWHNGTLLTILKADSSGAFTFNDPNAVPGDRYLLRFYFKDGTEVNRVIQLSSANEHLLEPAGQWNVTFQSGELDNNSLGYGTQLANGNVTHVGAWYGVTKDITAGVEAYHFPTQGSDAAGGVDLAWQTLPVWSNTFETLHYNWHMDYDWQSTYTGIEDHTIQFEKQQMAANSPIKQLALPLPYSINSILPTILPSENRFWSIKDIYSPNYYSLTSEYKRTDVGDTASETLQSSLSQSFSLSGTAGLVRPNFDYTQSYMQLTGYYYMNTDNMLQMQRTWAREQSNSLLGYRYQGLQDTHWSFGTTLEKPDHDNWQYVGNIQYNFAPNFSTTLNFDKHEMYLTFSYFGIVAQQPGPIDYNNYATGTVSGTVSAEAESGHGKRIPIKHAHIIAGGLDTYTDSKGHFFLSGLPTYQKIPFEIDPNSLDASLIPDKKEQVLYLRPGTFIQLNPQVDWSAGLDGNIIHDGPIPPKARVAILDKPGGKVLQTAAVEPNGFFIVDKLREGDYYIELEGVHDAPKAQKIHLRNQAHWLSNVDLAWNEAPIQAKGKYLAHKTSDKSTGEIPRLDKLARNDIARG